MSSPVHQSQLSLPVQLLREFCYHVNLSLADTPTSCFMVLVVVVLNWVFNSKVLKYDCNTCKPFYVLCVLVKIKVCVCVCV